jgi:hypothetical protein
LQHYSILLTKIVLTFLRRSLSASFKALAAASEFFLASSAAAAACLAASASALAAASKA